MFKNSFITAIIGCLIAFSCDKPQEDDPDNGCQTENVTPNKPEAPEQEEPDNPEEQEPQPPADDDGYELPDFSYAGYKYSEEAPCEWYDHGYRTYNIVDYGAIPDDGKSDREAFLAAVDAALGNIGYKIDGNGWIVFEHKEKANAIVYFPEGEYILHTAEDDVNGVSRSIQIRAGNFIIRGAGRDKTIIVMQDPNQPKNPSQMYSSPEMIQIKHNSSHASFPARIMVLGDSVKGQHHIKVSNAGQLAEGQWVCLYVNSPDKDLLAEQMHPYEAAPTWKIATDGVMVTDYHRIKSIDGDKVTFHEPLMTDVKAAYGWEIRTFPHYENIGIEDLTFKGRAKNDFVHHGSWENDGAYKPISLQRVTESWIRRVGFESVSEACSIINSANVSAYDIVMSGNAGHSSIRSQASSRVLIAATVDITSEGKGNFHGVGVSKQSIGTVLWQNIWGNGSCFESHASQPRATLIDCCTGGWHRMHAGGDRAEAPHHLADLVIWNFTATDISESDFSWWGDPNFNFLPPVIAGFNGPVTFPEEQAVIMDSGHIESLFETQMANRLGYLPDWIYELKSKLNN